MTCTDKPEKAFSGADAVSISMPIGSHEVCTLSDQASIRRGFIGSDQISASGAFRSLTGGRIVLDVAKKMEKYCPDAVLIDYANPVAAYSGMVNNHTKIRAFGICGGYANHRWDLTRIIDRKDEYCEKFKVVAAGINHLSFILRGTYHGEDIYKLLGDAVFTKDPKILADALFAYPINQNTRQGRALFKELLLIHKNEIDPVFQKAKDYI